MPNFILLQAKLTISIILKSNENFILAGPIVAELPVKDIFSIEFLCTKIVDTPQNTFQRGSTTF